MCDVAARCPACGVDLAAYETECTTVSHIGTDTDGINFIHTVVTTSPRHSYTCKCGAMITVTEPVPGLVQTRQDAVFKP